MSVTMENLAPREVYDVDESGYRERLGLVTGIFFGLFMGVACFFLTPLIIPFGWRALLSIGAGVFSGIVFGRNFPNRFRKKMSSFIDRLYAGDTEIDVPPPPEKELRYRLPCSWTRSGSFTVGGVLYIGPLGLLFVPHKKNLPRDRSPLEMGPNRSLKLSLTTPELTGLYGLLVPRPTPRLQVIWPEGTAQFIIPAPNQVFKLIEKTLQSVSTGISSI
jgi:hypothetical protein